MSQNEALGRWKNLFDLFQREQSFRSALTGDGSSAVTADVSGRIGWAWVRYDEKQDHASQVLNWRFPGIAQGVPVMVGKQYPTDRYFQILGVNLDLYLDSITQSSFVQYILPKHGASHYGLTGNDPAPIDVSNLAFGKVSATNPEGLTVGVSAFSFDNNGVYQTYNGGLVNLAADIPAGAGTHAYALVYLDPDTNLVGYVVGAATPVAVVPTPPDVIIRTIPLGLVLLVNGMTVIYESSIDDYRTVFLPFGRNLNVVAKAANYTATATDYTILVTCAAANITITLPAVANNTGRIYNVKKLDATAWTVIVDGDGAETIDGALTQTLVAQYDSIQVQCDGTGWMII